jgi:3-dehydroquinate dehydratase-1
MLRFGTLEFDGTPRIAVPFRDDVTPKTVEAAKSLGMDLAELRIDLFTNREPAHVLHVITRFQGVPLLATIRSSAEGGQWNGPDADCLALIEAILPSVDAVDIELSSEAIVDVVIRAAHECRKPAVVSYHNFTTTPPLEQLQRIADTARDRGADIVKVATHCTTRDDLRTLTRLLLAQEDKPTVAIGMGPRGATSRVLFPALGSLFTFASHGEPTAPGQFSLEETRRLLKTLC